MAMFPLLGYIVVVIPLRIGLQRQLARSALSNRTPLTPPGATAGFDIIQPVGTFLWCAEHTSYVTPDP